MSHKCQIHPSTIFGAPAIVGQRSSRSDSLSVHHSQVAEANDAALKMGCGAPFLNDGTWFGTRAEKAKYMKEINKRRVDEGDSRLVNFDGGYGDET